jgi:hypothetical protein
MHQGTIRVVSHPEKLLMALTTRFFDHGPDNPPLQPATKLGTGMDGSMDEWMVRIMNE